eukprot:g2433.t1
MYPRLSSRRALFLTRASDQDPEGSFTGDWPMNWSLASYEDISEFYGGQLMKEEGMGSYHLTDVMTKDLILTTPTTTRKELEVLFEEHTGIPVVDEKGRLLGIVSRSDLNRQGDVVKDLMSTPPIAAKPTARVADAACLMLKHKVHRIPIVDQHAKVIGFVTRTDIFEALEAETEISEEITK